MPCSRVMRSWSTRCRSGRNADLHRERATRTELAGQSGARESVRGSPRGEAPRIKRKRIMETRTWIREPGSTISEKLGASAGMWAVLWLVIHYLILRGTSADPKASDGDFVRLLLAERMSWEWATALRVMG